ncbi:hypothetical protein DMUE_2535 [Dictyocoela muelleri]|nr:hypothetical protein DMUE_2535 [Dictyocoela muelleri]
MFFGNSSLYSFLATSDPNQGENNQRGRKPRKLENKNLQAQFDGSLRNQNDLTAELLKDKCKARLYKGMNDIEIDIQIYMIKEIKRFKELETKQKYLNIV